MPSVRVTDPESCSSASDMVRSRNTGLAQARSARVALVCPTPWDVRQLERLRQASMPTTLLVGEDAERDIRRFPTSEFIRRTVKLLDGTVDGVVATSDYPGSLISSAIAQKLCLPGPSITSIVQFSDKFLSRLAQRESVPEATPAFCLVDPRNLEGKAFPLTFPVFVKPVKSTLSRNARLVESMDDLRALASDADLIGNLAADMGQLEYFRAAAALPGHHGVLIAEELLQGHQVTAEACVVAGAVHMLGLVDSIMHAGTISFRRFDYPSSLPSPVATRVRDIIQRLVNFVRFDQGLLNIEFFYDVRTEELKIIEVNPRMSPQFGELFRAVNGTSSYETLLHLAVGADPSRLEAPPISSAASSFVLRSFHNGVILNVPNDEEVRQIEDAFGAFIMNFYSTSDILSSDGRQFDGYSFRYCVVNLSGETFDELDRKFADVRRRLRYVIAPL